ncbi:hypothetical protein DH2020_046712 [Rehmannia glutinosa]|uniref:Uncharacterized protein n=1 Tax=Rehmannia glutinosa TaxID=99300 RepID=A0ABR0UBL2_REHGL
MKHELVKKSEEATNVESELRSKSRLLDEANEIVEKQNLELQQLEREIRKKEEELEISISLQKSDSEKLKAAETNLEKQTMDWLVVQEELKKLAVTSKHVGEANETLEEFGRVRKLLSDVRSELVSSQKALASSRQKMEGQDQLLEKQLTELEELRGSVMSYLTILRNAEVEVESERVKLRFAEAKNKELERDLSVEKEIEEIDNKTAAFEESQRLLKAKELELVEARLEIEHLQSEQASLQLILEEKDLELSNAKKRLEEVNQEIVELKGILFSRENELIQAMSMLKEKDEHVETMQHELSSAKFNFSEAETVVEKIVDLTKEVVLSFNDEPHYALSPFDENNDSFKWEKKQLEAELMFTRESLRAKEMEVLAAQKDLTIKDEELIMETIGEKSVGDLAIEKLQLEAAQLEVEAATSALYKITEMSRELLNKAGFSIEADYDTNISEARINMMSEKCSTEVKSEVSRLLSLTEQLVREASIAGNVKQ